MNLKLCRVKNCKYSTRYMHGDMCNTHYIRLKRHGTIDNPERPKEYHGMTKTSEYTSWQAMLSRCNNPKDTSYRYYGARGIKVHSDWLNSFLAFYKYIGKKPSQDYSIDRIDTNGNYEPGNVRWASRIEQVLNRRLGKNNTSGHLGVSWSKMHKKWHAQITIDYKAVSIGHYKNIEDAIKARKLAEESRNV